MNYGEEGIIEEVEVHGTMGRLQIIADKVIEGSRDPVVRRVAARILTGGGGGDGRWAVREKDWPNEVRAIFAFVRNNIRYTRDPPDRDFYQRARRILETRAADCDDLTIILGSLLMTVGYPLKFKIVAVRPPGTPKPDDFNHIYLLVGLPPRDPSRWVPLDASVEHPPGWEPPASMIDQAEVYTLEANE